MNEKKHFDSWFRASKYCQVVCPTKFTEQAARDGWSASARRNAEQFEALQQRLAEAEKLLNRCLPKLISGVHRTEIEDFLASPGCADGEKA